MNRIFTAALILAAGALAQAQPRINPGGVVNSASYAASNMPNGAIAQGSLFIVFGSGMGPATVQQVSAYPLATTLGGTSLSVTVNGTTTKPYVIYTSAGQVAAILPSNTPVGAGTLNIAYNGATSATEPIRVAANSFGIYASNQQGSGPGIITNTNFQVAASTASANPGEAYIIWGTGVGPVASGDESGPGVGVKLGTIPVEVLVGGKSATVIGYARASAASGLDQVAFTVPADVTGCAVPVAVRIGAVTSNFVSMPIAATGRTCTDAGGSGGGSTVSTGAIDLSRSVLAISAAGMNITSTTDSGSGSFIRSTAANIAATPNPLQITNFGACTVYTFKGSAPNTTVPDSVVLDAGPSLAVNGPGGMKTMTKSSGFYSASFATNTSLPGIPSSPLYLAKGTYTVTGTGGADVGPFTATLNVPDPLIWTNATGLNTVVRANGQLITWSSGDPNGNVYIIGFSVTGTGANANGAEFICLERNPAGRFMIPSAVLLALPASAAGSAGTASGALFVEGSTVGTFKASGLDQATISSSSITLNTVTFQ